MSRKKSNMTPMSVLAAVVVLAGAWVSNRCNASSVDGGEASDKQNVEVVKGATEETETTQTAVNAGEANGQTAKQSNKQTDTQLDDNSLCNVVVPKSLQAKCISLQRTAYTLLYNKEWRLPVWVGWHLTAKHTDGAYNRKGIKFAEDEDVPSPRATNSDYVNSGYDRGHICPSGDNKWSQEAQLQSFLYTNCCPQLHNLNAGDWRELEEKCRQWAQQYGSIYIVGGPLLLNKTHKTIGSNKVIVPEAFFKVVLCMEGTPKAIGFIYRNEQTNKKMSAYVNSVDEVERITGYDFFSALPDDIENAVERTADLGQW